PALPDNFAFDTLACEGAGLLIGFDFPEASYLWEDGSTEAFKSVPRSGNYRLLLQTACYQAEDTYEVTLEDCDCSERIPNMFSPNGDGINDSWWIEFAPGVEEVQWGIVDRWGRPVFEARGPDVRWEGRFAQRQAPEGVYFWWVRYRCWNGTEFAFTQSKGSLTLIR
ncbi:MAG: gliding motility-associated C-terminal domain-containing protein, partial [Bacteroidota bacterium]